MSNVTTRRKPRRPATAPADRQRWLLLIHQIPPKPDYFRVKIGRRLQRVGAVPIKNSVYVLPRNDEAYEDFEWTVREITEGGGDASVCEAEFVEGLSNDQIVALFHAARDADYAAISDDARRLSDAAAAAGAEREARNRTETELARLRRRIDEVAAIDYLGAKGRDAAEKRLAAVDDALRRAREGAEAATGGRATASSVRSRTWVTRQDVHVDRMASAWLIRRFIDADARFKFVAPKGYVPRPGELRFDMFDAEYTHEGERCTFETLVKEFALRDAALGAIGDLVHDIDFKVATFERPETAGVERLLAGIASLTSNDAERVERASAALDALYAGFQAQPRRRRSR
jgi:hypothetical protein